MFRFDQHTKHSYDIETHPSCDNPCTTLVDQNQTSSELHRECNRFCLSVVQLTLQGTYYGVVLHRLGHNPLQFLDR